MSHSGRRFFSPRFPRPRPPPAGRPPQGATAASDRSSQGSPDALQALALRPAGQGHHAFGCAHRMADFATGFRDWPPPQPSPFGKSETAGREDAPPAQRWTRSFRAGRQRCRTCGTRLASFRGRACNPQSRAVDARHFTGGVRACRGEIPAGPPVGPSKG